MIRRLFLTNQAAVLLPAAFWALFPAAAKAEIRVAAKVTVSVAPGHSLIAGVMSGVGSPEPYS